VTEDSQSADSPPQGSVFGNLPGARPGPRSPRRESGKKEAGRLSESKAQEKPRKPQTKTRPQPRERQPPGQPAGTPQPPLSGARSEGIGGIEDLAWAGVAAAAEAATLGVRLASRAFDALRGSPERD
jgi:hypothetical protein